MTGQTRREFLVATGGLLATSTIVGSQVLAEEHKTGEPTTPAPRPATIPPHRQQTIEGVHAYTDRPSARAGETIHFHVSSSYPYELQVCRLGPNVDGPEQDEILHSFGHSQENEQPIEPGSYLLADKPLDADGDLPGLTLEVWIRRWHTLGRQAIISQFDEPDACGLALWVNENGSLGFYAGNGGRYDERSLLTTPPGQLQMELEPAGLKTQVDNTPSSVRSNRWHHVVARLDGSTKQIWVDGKMVAEAKTSVGLRAGSAPLRIGSTGRKGRADYLLDADLAMPAIYARALSAEEIAARFATTGLEQPSDPALLACWPLEEEKGDRVADSSGNGRDGRIINQATWMIGGPSFAADVPRFGDYTPQSDPRRGHGLRLASDDLYDCRWNATHSYALPTGARSGMYVGRIRFELDGHERLYHVVFIVRPAKSGPKAPVALVAATNTWKAYSATPFSENWPGIKISIGNNGFVNSPGNPPAYCFYRPHRAGQGTYQLGFRMPWPIVGPYTLMGRPDWDYSHLCRQDRHTQVWLERQGYRCDVLSDSDLDLDPQALDGYRAVFVVGHSEYWSGAALDNVGRYLDGGGNLILLSGNTAFWRVSLSDDGNIIECRKGDAPGTQVRADRRGEMWHSHDGQRGGLLRECGRPAWQLFGLEYCSLLDVGAPGVGPYKVRNANHFLFRQPNDLELKAGDSLGGGTSRLPQPIGHEGDVRVSTLAKYLAQPPPQGATLPTEDPPGITLLAEGFVDSQKVAFAWDYFQRPLPQGKTPPLDVAAEMIFWERPSGGRVFHAGSINAGSTLAVSEKWSGLLKNVLHHFGVSAEAVS